MREISVSSLGKVHRKTNPLADLQCYKQLADLLEKSLPPYRYMRPPGTLISKTKRVNHSCTKGACPTASKGGRNWICYCPVRLEPISADGVLPLPHLELEDLRPRGQHVDSWKGPSYLSAKGVPTMPLCA